MVSYDKVRVAGDSMITNVEQDRRHLLRKGERLAAIEAELLSNGHANPTAKQRAYALGVSESER